LAFRENQTLEDLIKEVVKQEPYSSVVTDDEFEHTLWLASKEVSLQIVNEFKNVPQTYIADGHHWTAAAFNVGKRRRQAAIDAGVNVTGEEHFNYFMSLIYPSNQLKIMDYNRVLKSLKGLTTDQFMEKLFQYYTIESLPDDAPRSPQNKG